MISVYIRLMRPVQWVKNLYVLLPLFFGGALLSGSAWVCSLWAMAAFCLASSAVYCLNDIVDLRADAAHPRKRHRPVASGRVGVGSARFVMLVLAGAALLLTWFGFGNVTGQVIVIAVYMAMNVAYSCVLKRVALVDVTVVALGFVLRLVMGGLACGIALSPWIVIMVFLLSLFMAMAKRRDDLVVTDSAAGGDFTLAEVRPAAAGYSLPYLDTSLALLASVTVVCYILYTVSPETVVRLGSPHLYATSIFVLLGMLRYLRIALVEHRSGDPAAVMLHDRFILVCLACWVLSFVLIIYC